MLTILQRGSTSGGRPRGRRAGGSGGGGRSRNDRNEYPRDGVRKVRQLSMSFNGKCANVRFSAGAYTSSSIPMHMIIHPSIPTQLFSLSKYTTLDTFTFGPEKYLL